MTELKDYSTELACALNGYRALIVPGLHNANSDHWQSLWEKSIPGARRILMHDWHSPNWVKWRNSIIASLIAIDEPVVLIAEGFGALAAASVAEEYPGKIIALFLVNPADPDAFELRKKLPKQSLPIPTRIIASNPNEEAKSAYLALLWKAEFVDAVCKTDSNYWPEAIDELQELVGQTIRMQEEATRMRLRLSARHQHRYQTKYSIAAAF